MSYLKKYINRLDVMYNEQLISTIVTTTVTAWSLEKRALNIWLTVGDCIFTVDFSLMQIQVMVINTIKSMATISVNHLKPSLSISLPASSPASFTASEASAAFPASTSTALSEFPILPSIGTHIIVITVIIAEPTPAHERASVERFSLSLPPSVKAGIIDQNGISIIVYVIPHVI